MVLDAGKDNSSLSRPALQELCKAYWNPLHTYVLRCGVSSQDAEDMTQAFFAHLLDNNLPGRATPERGRFRAFLLTAMKNFVAAQNTRAAAVRRGGTAEVLSLDEEESDLPNSIPDPETPETAYDRKWAHTVLEIALGQLAAEQAGLKQESRFEVLRPLLFEPMSDLGEAAKALNMPAGNVRTALSRLRGRFRDHVRAEVARLVDDPAEVDAELAYLLQALRG